MSVLTTNTATSADVMKEDRYNPNTHNNTEVVHKTKEMCNTQHWHVVVQYSEFHIDMKTCLRI